MLYYKPGYLKFPKINAVIVVLAVKLVALKRYEYSDHRKWIE